MRRIISVLAALIAAVAITTGASGSSSQIGPYANTCTIYFPNASQSCSQLSWFSPNQTYGWVTSTYGTASGWRVSPSNARRFHAGVSIWGECLPAHARLMFQYSNASGFWTPAIIASEYGACYLSYGESSGSNYVKVRCKIEHMNGYPAVSRWLACHSWWY